VAAVDPGTGGVGNFSTGIDEISPRSAALVVGTSPGEAPIPPYLDLGTQLRWAYNGTLGIGESSQIMFYTSPNGPELNSMTANSGLASGNVYSASPVPEPGTLILWLVGGAVVAVRMRLRRSSP
jgi:hypothetical protein